MLAGQPVNLRLEFLDLRLEFLDLRLELLALRLALRDRAGRAQGGARSSGGEERDHDARPRGPYDSGRLGA